MKVGYIAGGKALLENQRDALSDANCERVFVDAAAPVAGIMSTGLIKTLNNVSTGDMLVVVSLDCLGCTPADIAIVARKLLRVGAALQVIDAGLDTSVSPGGKQALIALEAIARLDSVRRSNRTKESMQAAKKKGARFGPHHKLSEDQIARARDEIESGRATQQEMARKLRVSGATMSRALQRVGDLAEFP